MAAPDSTCMIGVMSVALSRLEITEVVKVFEPCTGRR